MEHPQEISLLCPSCKGSGRVIVRHPVPPLHNATPDEHIIFPQTTGIIPHGNLPLREVVKLEHCKGCNGTGWIMFDRKEFLSLITK
jgi:hypothetical protein